MSSRCTNVQQEEANHPANRNYATNQKPVAARPPAADLLRRRLRQAALVCLGFSAAGIAVSGLAHSSPLTSAGLAAPTPPLVSSRAVPAYFSDDANWTKIKLQAGGITYAVMNPDSGPGVASDPTWVTRLANIGLTNPSIVGYVDTSYAARPLTNVQADISKYMQWYGVKSIFLDQTPFGCLTASYYSAIAATVHANGGIVIMNPGTLPLGCMIDIGDVIVSFENSLPYYLTSTATNPAGYAPQKFWHLIYAVPANRQREIEELARQRGAGYVYVTADDLPNPWSRVETFPATPITAPGTVIPNDATTTTTTTAPPNTLVTTVPTTAPTRIAADSSTPSQIVPTTAIRLAAPAPASVPSPTATTVRSPAPSVG
jgi:Spherulation-specific family 4